MPHRHRPARRAHHTSSVCPAFDPGANTVYVDLTRHGASARAIRENPNVAVLIDEYHDDWSKLKAVILHCRAEPVQGEELALAQNYVYEGRVYFAGVYRLRE